ncbi:MAG: SIR2 family protein [Gemmatimonadota bacterium]|nr:SIR2 family protein [Gemmatimonadota bacterium]
MRSIDPIHSLAFSMQANPGVYAVLVGSGVSRSAMIPTGWEITLNLICKLAASHGEECGSEPERWYLEKFGKEASYSDLLNDIAKTQAERQQLLGAYFEPTDKEREEGAKAPTAAHRAIAGLAANGFIKVIITTNFDQLLETALRDEGVEPTILSSPDQVQGALPLIHTDCCVFKVNGDYLDTRIRNTPAELDEFPREFDELLDRIFDEFGLIVCGWSAEWDAALRSALSRAPSRRFTTFWAVRGKSEDKAQRLIDLRGAQVIKIEDADAFFAEIQQNVTSIEEYSRPHPLSTESAVASLERYLPDPRYRIQLSNLIQQTVEQVVEMTSGEDFDVQLSASIDSESVTKRLRRYEAACATLMAMATSGGRWAEEEHNQVWQRALQRLGSTDLTGGVVFWIDLVKYPATLLLYALGLGAVEAGRLRFLRNLFGTTIHRQHKEDLAAVRVLPPSCMFDEGGQEMQELKGMENRHTPLNAWIHDVLQTHTDRIIPDVKRYTRVFDKLETLMALGCAHEDPVEVAYWPPLGAFAYRRERIRVFQEIEKSLETMQDESPYVTSGIFGATAEECKQGLTKLKEFLPNLRWR